MTNTSASEALFKNVVGADRWRALIRADSPGIKSSEPSAAPDRAPIPGSRYALPTAHELERLSGLGVTGLRYQSHTEAPENPDAKLTGPPELVTRP
jgi:hypothetical protein